MPNSRCWDRETIEDVREALANASDPPSTTLSTRQAIDELADVIRAKREAGWRRRDIVAFLKERGVEIPEATLRTYATGRRTSARSDASASPDAPGRPTDAGIDRRPDPSDNAPGRRPRSTEPVTPVSGACVTSIEQDDV